MSKLAAVCVLAAFVAVVGCGDDERPSVTTTTTSPKRQSTTTPGTAPTPVMPTLIESPTRP